MGRYSIKDLEQITGIKAHTIRIWEKRYAIVEPKRTETNIRYYSNEDLKKLLNISMLNAQGIKISHLAKLEEVDIEAKVVELSRTNKLEDTSIDKLILATINFDEELFESIVSKCLYEKGMEDTIIQVLFPFFNRVGVLWQVGSISPAQEHFISNLMRQKLFAAIDSVSGSVLKNAKKLVFFLQEGELHEMSILFYNYIAKKNGFKTLYLGQNLPFEDVENVIRDYQPDGLVSSFTGPFSVSELSAYLKKMNTTFKGLKIFVTGLKLQQKEVVIPKRFGVISSASEFKKLIAKID
ncbi:MerR family transcriptional regulator [Ancylomarina sp. DW003]|nr:MerR family transcriptional regulator [Ancylomarina sp. DW003]MDE5422457.1 MerR family transcriptional regulator [Ancylomarina sp. DW003]